MTVIDLPAARDARLGFGAAARSAELPLQFTALFYFHERARIAVADGEALVGSVIGEGVAVVAVRTAALGALATRVEVRAHVEQRLHAAVGRPRDEVALLIDAAL